MVTIRAVTPDGETVTITLDDAGRSSAGFVWDAIVDTILRIFLEGAGARGVNWTPTGPSHDAHYDGDPIEAAHTAACALGAAGWEVTSTSTAWPVQSSPEGAIA